MHAEDSIAKTLGAQSARLIVSLYDTDREIFNIKDVCASTGLSEVSARSLVRNLSNRGLVTRLKPGLFHLVPLQMGSEREYVGNQFAVAANLARGADYYISHSSAMDIHGMLTQPQFVVYITMVKAHRPLVVHGTEYRFVRAKETYLYGISEQWIDKQHKVFTSDLEKTIIDGLKQPQYCGGFSDLAKGFWMRRSDMIITKLADYALQTGVSVVARRLGFMLDLFDVRSPEALERLKTQATRPYLLLDPQLPDEGIYDPHWKLRINVEPAEILASVRT